MPGQSPKQPSQTPLSACSGTDRSPCDCPACRSIFDHIPVALFMEDWRGIKQAVDQIVASGVKDLAGYIADHPTWLAQLYGTRTIVDVNQAAVRLYAALDKEQLKKVTVTIFPETDLNAFEQMVLAIAQGQRHFECHSGHRTAQGQPIFVIFALDFPATLDDFSRLVVSATDVTVQKNLENQLLHAQKMESIGTMAAGLAHDFNNLLMGIMGNVSLVMEMVDQNSPVYSRLQNIDSYVQRGSELSHQLLGFAKGEQCRTRPTHLNSLIQNNARVFGRTNKGLSLHLGLAEDPWTIEVDRGQIDQVLYNLYLNALHAMENVGDLYIETRNVTLPPKETAAHNLSAGRYVEILVRDTGKGMDERTLPRIFDPFFSTKERGRGTGLGLTAAYGIIKNHSGFITAQSTPGQGATFRIYLPASNKRVDVDLYSSKKITNGSGTILFVDDEEMITEVVGTMIQKLGYCVQVARSGREAIQIYQAQHDRIDLIIMDMIMPEMDGCQTYFELKEINPDVKVLLCSGFSVEGKTETALSHGCVGFMQKPISLSTLSEKISAVCGPKQSQCIQ